MKKRRFSFKLKIAPTIIASCCFSLAVSWFIATVEYAHKGYSLQTIAFCMGVGVAVGMGLFFVFAGLEIEEEYILDRPETDPNFQKSSS